MQQVTKRVTNKVQWSRVILLLLTTVASAMLFGCGGSSSSGPGPNAQLAGNWQFTMATQGGNPGDPTFSGGLQGGFLLDSNNSVSGQAVYFVQASDKLVPCNAGTAPTTATLSGLNVSITAVAGTQTFSLTGTLSSDGSTMMGAYNSTAGTAADGSPCGYAETGLSWSAVLVPALSGSVSGSVHSTSLSPRLQNQDFAVSGTLTQGQNIGASSATVTGQLTFVDPVSGLSDYPCFSIASVNGTISGNSVILQLIDPNGLTVAQIGEPAALVIQTGVNPVTVASAQGGGYILNGTGPSYIVSSKACPGTGGLVGGTNEAGDFGNLCLGVNSTACQEPLTLSPGSIVFPAQVLNSAPTSQTITLTNNSAATLSGLTLGFSNITDSNFPGQSDFNGLPSFTETDACGAGGAPSQGNQFDLGAGQSCLITVTFAPQEGCPWLPFPGPPSINGAPPEFCLYPQGATVTLKNATSTDSDTSFAVPVSGTGVSAIQPSVPELDFGAEEQFNPQETSLPQALSFTNNSSNPVYILPSEICQDPYSVVNGSPVEKILALPRPLGATTSQISGLQVVSTVLSPNNVSSPYPTVGYTCDIDFVTARPNFQISSDTCSGTTLYPQQGCSLQVTYEPQPDSKLPIGSTGLDYFLELNTEQCASPQFQNGAPPGSPCEIDSGRFSVELKSNGPSPLRMSPGAGLNFGTQKKGTTSAPMTVTLQNDPNLTYPNCQAGVDCSTVTFVGRIQVSGNFVESDDCPATLPQGSQCTVSVTFAPTGSGFTAGSLTINYTQPSNSGAVTTGNPQTIYLRGTGQ
jgi:hypothetical protein